MDENSKALTSSLSQAANIVAAYVSNNSLRAADLPELIAIVHSSIRHISQGLVARPEAPPETPAVPIKKSVTRDYIVCLEDGKRFKSLRRHLSTHHNMTPEQYRTKWGLPSDHPMVAPAYSATRSQLAKDSGLGLISREPSEAANEKPKAVAAKTVEAAKKQGRGRPKKVASA